jgi:putative hydrolase of the HAD superfamily
MNKVISLDFWGTIASPNPAYGKARKRLFAKVFGVSEEEAHRRYLTVKRDCDATAELHGAAITPLLAVRKVLGSHTLARKTNAAEVLGQLEEIVQKHPPIMHPEIAGVVNSLQEMGYLVGVASNTNFIAGRLQDRDSSVMWNFTVYSDEIGVSKPDPDFFNMVVRAANDAIMHDDIAAVTAGSVTHIGDNAVCDVAGAKRIGMNAILVHSPDETVNVLKMMCMPAALVN